MLSSDNDESLCLNKDLVGLACYPVSESCAHGPVHVLPSGALIAQTSLRCSPIPTTQALTASGSQISKLKFGMEVPHSHTMGKTHKKILYIKEENF